jgi:hypothetical protein
MSRFDWINSIKDRLVEVAKTGLDFSATSDCVVTVPEGLDIETLDQVHLKTLCDILTEEADVR